MVDSLVHQDAVQLRDSPAFGQVIRRWIAVGLMAFAAAFGMLSLFMAQSDARRSTSPPQSVGAIVLPLIVGAVLAGICGVVTYGLVRRLRRRSPKTSSTMILGALVLVIGFAGLVQFLLFGVFIVIVGLPITKFGPPPPSGAQAMHLETTAGVRLGGGARRLLLAAYAWTVLCAVVAFTAPFFTGNLTHTRAGLPVAPGHESLFAFNHHLVIEVAIFCVMVLAVATVELAWRLARRHYARGIATTIVASCLMAYSIYGVIFGVASVGLIGLLALLSAKPIRADVLELN